MPGAILACMELKEALEHAQVIIVEEEKRPTLHYESTLKGWPERVKAQNALPGMRTKRPREVLQDPTLWEIKGRNYGAILELFRQLGKEHQGMFLGGLLNKTRQRSLKLFENQHVFPSWNSHTSALPLVAEICIRNGHLDLFLKVLSHVEMPNPSLAVMMIQLEETISLNFDVFSQAELKAMPASMMHLWEIANRQTYMAKRDQKTNTKIPNEHFRQGFMAEGTDVANAVQMFLKECEQADSWYVLGTLKRIPNLEIESDRTKVIGFLEALGFDDPLKALLERAEALYLTPSDQFDLKNCLSLIRTFYEHMHLDTGKALADSLGTTVVPEWDPVITFLQNKLFFTPQQGKFVRGLHTLLSDEGVHALIAEREFARLLRNMVIEYGVMFLTIMEKKGIKITP
jgi:hypothetical protein